MRLALEAVKEGEIGTSRATRTFGVPATTLKKRLSGRIKHGTNTGPPPNLSRGIERTS